MFTAKRILIVEDDQLIRTLYKRALEKAGYQVSEAGDGQEGLTKMIEGGYDLVLLDVMLPGLNGFDILKKLHEKASANKANKKIVVLTNLDEETSRDDSNFFQVDGYLVKNKLDVTKLADELQIYL